MSEDSSIKNRLSNYLGGIGGVEQGDLEQSGAMSQSDIVDSIDAEVKRVSEFFRFILKYKQQFQPSGVEFSGLRQYVVTDDASRIDWKNSAGKPDLYVKQYEEEKNMDTFVLLDGSRTMQLGTAEKLKSEYASLVASTIAYASTDAGLDVGFAIYGGNEVIMNPDGGNAQYRQVLHEITKDENYGGKFNLEDSLNDVIAKIKDDTVVFIISDFLQVDGAWKSTVKVASEKFRHVMCIMVRDLRDYKLPEDGNVRLESPYGDEKTTVNTDKVREKYNELAEEQEAEIEQTIEEAGASFMKMDTREDFASKFASYFDEEGEKW